jgi:hypothetical protein
MLDITSPSGTRSGLNTNAAAPAAFNAGGGLARRTDGLFWEADIACERYSGLTAAPAAFAASGSLAGWANGLLQAAHFCAEYQWAGDGSRTNCSDKNGEADRFHFDYMPSKTLVSFYINDFL